MDLDHQGSGRTGPGAMAAVPPPPSAPPVVGGGGAGSGSADGGGARGGGGTGLRIGAGWADRAPLLGAGSAGRGPLLGRRGLLRAGLGLGGLAVVGTGAALALSGRDPGPGPAAGPSGTAGAPAGAPSTASAPATPTPSGVVPSLRNEEQRSAARNGATVKMITIVPQGPGVPPAAELPVCVALHGRGATAQAWTELGLPQVLVSAIAAGIPPFAVVALDGGDATYWRRTQSGDDPQRMLLEELPGWLAARGLRAPTGAMGISMGGFGSLRYARNRGAAFGPVAALSPALFRTWSAARAVGVFKDEADWREHEPLLHQDQPHGRPIGVWCGTEDPFCDAARRLAGDNVQARFTAGAHDAEYWRRILPDVVAFLGPALANRSAG
ncbi:alpha/beta hydrolase [Kitasatospora sp. NPDC054939]